MDNLGIGIIGCGVISDTYLKLAPLFAGIEVRAIADINSEAAHSRSEEFGVPAVSVDDLLDSSDITIVVNLTVPDAHFKVSRQILKSGKHVYTEKPLVLTLKDGFDLQKLASENGLRIGSAPDTFLGSSHQLARAKIDEGLIGNVVSGTAHVMSHGMEHWHPNPDFFFLPGGGPVLDIGPYYITNLVQLIGPIRRVTSLTSSACETRTILTEGPRKGEIIPVRTPTNIHALLEFHSGATVTLSTSWDVWAHRHTHMELYGADGTLFLPDPNFFGGSVDYSGRDRKIVTLDPWEHPFGIPNGTHPVLGSLSNYRMAGLADMAQAIINRRAHRCSFELALHAVDAMTSILRAGEKDCWIKLTTNCVRPELLDPDAAQSLLIK